jgi:hypothetical protein
MLYADVIHTHGFPVDASTGITKVEEVNTSTVVLDEEKLAALEEEMKKKSG